MPFNVSIVEGKALKNPVIATAAGFTGGWVDCQGLIFDGTMKAVLEAGASDTPGTCGGSIQSASTTAGANLATETTFTGLTSAGGIEESHFVPTANNRYIRILGSVQTGKTMYLAGQVYGAARVKP